MSLIDGIKAVAYKSYPAWRMEARGTYYRMLDDWKRDKAYLKKDLEEALAKAQEIRAKLREPMMDMTVTEYCSRERWQLHVRRCQEFASEQGVPCEMKEPLPCERKGGKCTGDECSWWDETEGWCENRV